MKEPKRHHYVPISYLEFFSDLNKVWVYDKKDKKYFNPSLENVTVIQHYYTMVIDDLIKDLTIEKHFSKIESTTKPILDKLNCMRKITSDERAVLALFISYQFTRVPAYERNNKNLMNQLLETMEEWEIPEEEPDGTEIPDFLPPDTPRVSVRGLHNHLVELRDSEVKFKNQHLEMMIKSAEHLVGSFLSLEWTFIYAGENSSFITSSNPFTFTFYDEREKPRSMGVLVRDVIKLFPLTPNVCLMMGNVGTSIKTSICSAQTVKNLNLTLAHNSDRYLIHRDKDVLEAVVKIL